MIFIQHSLKLFLISFVIALSACSSTPPAPVIDRLPSYKNAPAVSTKSSDQKPNSKAGDWRPNTYTVKKGDTLYSIGLEFGYDYKEIADFNQISPPYPIKIGQVLKFQPIATAENVENSDGVTTVPFGDDSAPIAAKNNAPSSTTSNTPTTGTTVLNSPKASRIPYSDAAFEKPAPVIIPPKMPTAKAPAVVTPPDEKIGTKPALDPKVDPKLEPKTEILTKYETAESVDWSWPHGGKVVNGFNEASNKGLDIAGSLGQPVLAAAAGKVIYSGSDLRGYGKLVIIKHNPLYLSVYAHNSLIVVKEGQLVNRGQKIAEMGNSESNSVKLHFEIRRQGKSVDPKLYLPANY